MEKWLSRYKSCIIPETGQDMTKVTTEDQLEVPRAFLIGAKINQRPWRVIMMFQSKCAIVLLAYLFI